MPLHFCSVAELLNTHLTCSYATSGLGIGVVPHPYNLLSFARVEIPTYPVPRTRLFGVKISDLYFSWRPTTAEATSSSKMSVFPLNKPSLFRTVTSCDISFPPSPIRRFFSKV